MFTTVSQTQTGMNLNQMSITEAWKNTLLYLYNGTLPKNGNELLHTNNG